MPDSHIVEILTIFTRLHKLLDKALSPYPYGLGDLVTLRKVKLGIAIYPFWHILSLLCDILMPTHFQKL